MGDGNCRNDKNEMSTFMCFEHFDLNIVSVLKYLKIRESKLCSGDTIIGLRTCRVT